MNYVEEHFKYAYDIIFIYLMYLRHGILIGKTITVWTC